MSRQCANPKECFDPDFQLFPLHRRSGYLCVRVSHFHPQLIDEVEKLSFHPYWRAHKNHPEKIVAFVEGEDKNSSVHVKLLFRAKALRGFR